MSVASPPVVAPVVPSPVEVAASVDAPPAETVLDAPPAEAVVTLAVLATALTPPKPLEAVPAAVLLATALEAAVTPPIPLAAPPIVDAVPTADEVEEVEDAPPALGPTVVGVWVSALVGSAEQPTLDATIHSASEPLATTKNLAFMSMSNAPRRPFDPRNCDKAREVGLSCRAWERFCDPVATPSECVLGVKFR